MCKAKEIQRTIKYIHKHKDTDVTEVTKKTHMKWPSVFIKLLGKVKLIYYVFASYRRKLQWLLMELENYQESLIF